MFINNQVEEAPEEPIEEKVEAAEEDEGLLADGN